MSAVRTPIERPLTPAAAAALRTTVGDDIELVGPLFVALLHGSGCKCADAKTAVVVGPFVNAQTNALLAWAKGQCKAGLVARMLPPGPTARIVTGSR